jgi:hypothetical protein
MNTPGFTAEAAVRNPIRHYSAVAIRAFGGSRLIPALQIGQEPDWVDCNEPFAYYCIECGSTGPGSIRCCRNDYCAVIDRRLSSAYTGSVALRR